MSTGLILQVGNTAEPAAGRVQRARGWNIERVSDTEAACEVLRASLSGPVLITAVAGSTGPDFFLSAAHAAAVGSPHASLGALVGWTAEELLDAAARFEGEPRAAQAGREPLICPADMTFRGARMVEFEGARGPGDVLPFIGQTAELGFIFGHSSGLDMEAGPATMCRRFESDTIAADELRVFPCFRGAECGRCRPGQPQAGPSMLRTRRLVLICCWGVTLSGALFDPAQTIGQGLLRNPHVEALVTTMRVAHMDSLDLPHIYYLANQGLSLGEVANRTNQFRLTRGLPADFICFGDPSSRVQGSVELVTATRSEAGAYHVATGDGAAARDLVVSLEGESVPEEPIVVVEGDSPVYGVCEPRHAVFLSVPARATEVEFRVVDRRELVPSEALNALANDLTLAGSYARAIIEQTQSTEALEALDAVDVARDAIETSPLLALALGTVLSSAFVDEAFSDLQSHLTASAHSVMTAFANAVRRLSSVHPAHVWQPRARLSSSRPCGSCPYCSSSCDEAVLEMRVGGGRRSGIFCRACGLIFDGDPALGHALVTPATVAGERIKVELPVKNPYPMAVPACGVAMLESFKRGDCTVSDIRTVRVPSGKAGSLPIELTVADSLLPGVYYLAGGLMVGGRVQFFRRPLHIGRGRA